MAHGHHQAPHESFLHAIGAQARLSLALWLDPLLRLVLKPPSTTLMDSADWSGQFPPIGAIEMDLRRMRETKAPRAAEENPDAP